MKLHAKLLISLLAATTASMAGAQQDTMPTGAGFNQPITTPDGEVKMPQDVDDTRAPVSVQGESELSNGAPVAGTVQVAPPVEDPATGDTMAAPPAQSTDPMATVPAPATGDDMVVDPTETEESLTATGSGSDPAEEGAEAASDAGTSISGTSQPVTGGVTVEESEPRPITDNGVDTMNTEARGGDATAQMGSTPGTAVITTEDGQVYTAQDGQSDAVGGDAEVDATSMESDALGSVNEAESDAQLDAETMDGSAQSAAPTTSATGAGS